VGTTTMADWLKIKAEQEARELGRAQERIDWLMRAYHAGDADGVWHNMTCDDFPWAMALREFAKLTSVPPEMQNAFWAAWIETKHLSFIVNNQPLLCAAARAMSPPYAGPAIRLFRGAVWLERQRRGYGLSWTDDIAAAEDFAKGYQVWPGGSVVLETLAPPEAIICKMPYAEPLSEEKRAEILGDHPNAHFPEYHDEREYVVDRRQLTRVKVVQRFPETPKVPGAGHE
jgi:hypothetical protein